VAAYGGRQGLEPIATEGASLKAADITFYRAAYASAVANGVSLVPFLQALRELGVSV
jgi:hypothetical protein